MRGRFVLVVLALSVAWPATARAQTGCTPAAQNLFVRDRLEDLYLWYRELPDADPTRFPSPEAYLDAVRYRRLDSTFSYVTSRAASDAFFDESQFVGLGFSTVVRDGQVVVLQVFDGSPAADVGIDRGSRLIAIDGVPVEKILATGSVTEALGPATVGYEVRLEVVTRAGAPRVATMRKRVVTIPTVSVARVLDLGGTKVGYLFFRNFVRPSTAALDQAFATFAAAGVTELVLDLRYNGGGLVDVAVHLGALIGGIRTRDQVFAEYRHNDRNTRRNETLRFDEAPHALGLARVVAVTTRATASASELVINALRPFAQVVTVGERTFGKPVGQYQLRFCDKVLAPVSFSLVNANGEGDYFEGLDADCDAADDVSADLGAAQEASLAEALTVIRTGTCSAPPSARPTRLRRTASARPDAWASLLNAH